MIGIGQEIQRLLANPPKVLLEKSEPKVAVEKKERIFWPLEDQLILKKLMDKGMKTAAIQKAGYFTDKTAQSVSSQCSKIRLRGITDPAMRNRLPPEKEALLIKLKANDVSYSNISRRLSISTATARKRYMEIIEREKIAAKNGQ